MEAKRSVPYHLYSADGSRKEGSAPLVREAPLTIRLNGRVLVTLLCTPAQVDRLVVGFLHGEGLIATVDEVVLLGLYPDQGLADVWLEDEGKVASGPRVLTSGCGAGATQALEQVLPPLRSQTCVRPAEIDCLLRATLAGNRMYRESGAVHGAALWRGGRLLAQAEDVGRHNAVDKVVGECLLSGLPTEGALLLTTGRISSEMLLKAGRALLPVVASLSSPTDRAVGLAEELAITVIGYVRGHSMRVYSHAWRLEC